MKEALRNIVEDRMGIKKPAAITPHVRPDNLRAIDMMTEPELQEAQWQNGIKRPVLSKQADKIVKALKGKDVYARYLAAEHGLYEKYIYAALSKAGYTMKEHVGSPSVGFDYHYVLIPALKCPHCNADLPKNYVIK